MIRRKNRKKNKIEQKNKQHTCFKLSSVFALNSMYLLFIYGHGLITAAKLMVNNFRILFLR